MENSNHSTFGSGAYINEEMIAAASLQDVEILLEYTADLTYTVPYTGEGTDNDKREEFWKEVHLKLWQRKADILTGYAGYDGKSELLRPGTITNRSICRYQGDALYDVLSEVKSLYAQRERQQADTGLAKSDAFRVVYLILAVIMIALIIFGLTKGLF